MAYPTSPRLASSSNDGTGRTSLLFGFFALSPVTTPRASVPT